jgi:hypothetical protein
MQSLDVLAVHVRDPVIRRQPWSTVGRDPYEARRADDAVGQARCTGKRMRAATRSTSHAEPVNAQLIR